MHLSHSGNWMKKQKISFERFKCELWDLGKANIFEVKNIYGFSGDWQIITQPSLFQLSGHWRKRIHKVQCTRKESNWPNIIISPNRSSLRHDAQLYIDRYIPTLFYIFSIYSNIHRFFDWHCHWLIWVAFIDADWCSLILADVDADAVTPGVTHHRPSDGNFLNGFSLLPKLVNFVSNIFGRTAKEMLVSIMHLGLTALIPQNTSNISSHSMRRWNSNIHDNNQVSQCWKPNKS